MFWGRQLISQLHGRFDSNISSSIHRWRRCDDKIKVTRSRHYVVSFSVLI
jgi:hypothetical protein